MAAGEQIPETVVSNTPAPAPVAQPTEEQQLAEHQARLDAYIAERAKAKGVAVKSMPAPRTATSTPTSPAPAAPTSVQKTLDALRDPNNPDGLFSKDAAKQKAAVAEFRRLAAGEMTDEELATITNSSVEELRHRFGLGHRVPEYMAEQWDQANERDVLATFAAQGLSASQVAPLTQWYQDQFIGAGGDVANINAAEMEAEFRQVAKRAGLPEALVNDLVKHERKRLGLTK